MTKRSEHKIKLGIPSLTDESRISNNESEHPILLKNEVDIAFNYVHTWPTRQCMCCYRDVKNFERFNLIIQSIVCLSVCQLKNIHNILLNSNNINHKNLSGSNSNNNNNNVNTGNEIENIETSSNSPKVVNSPVDESIKPIGSNDEIKEGTIPEKIESSSKNNDEKWNLQELEKLLLLVSKVFLLNFPLYVAYKHGVQARWDEISAQEAQSFSLFCDFHDTEVPAFLFRNVSLFCNSGGFSAMTLCFEQATFPVSTAHAITAIISNLKMWLNYRSIVQLFIPIRIKVLQYMCKLSDQDLRSPPTRSMADFMWAAVKDPLDSQITFDTEGLALAFKYFTSSTLTMRLAGMAQINAHINLFNDICTSETVAEVEIVGQKLADWLTENQIISHLFGPNLHVEVIKQSHIVLNFLAVENQMTEDHITLIWQAAQLKHCSKTVYDILPSLVKNLAAKPAMHLYFLVSRLDPKEHTEQSIYIAQALTKLIWARDNSREQGTGLISSTTIAQQDTSGAASSSENSVSIDGTNSDEDQHDEESSEDRKSPIEIEGCSDSGAPPCKQARHKICDDPINELKINEKNADNLVKVKESALPIMDRIMVSLHEGSTSDEEEEDDDIIGNENFAAIRKKFRKRKKTRLTKKPIEELVETISDVESPSDGAAINDSDCSDTQIQASVLNHLHADGPFISAIPDGHIIDILSGAENDESYSSPMSNKSEKNMADFDDEDSPCEEELVQLAQRAHCLSFSIPRARSASLRDGTSDQGSTSGSKSERRSSGNKSNGEISIKDGCQSNFQVCDVCQPGNTLLWDLLQDDKIGQLGDSLALEAEKALGNLLCFNTDKFIRTKFIEGCLQNLSSNKSVVVSLRLLPKLFASFQQFRASDTHQVTMWAERQHKMMNIFFNNLKHYANSSKQNNLNNILNQNGGSMYSHLTQVQVRLQFLTSVMSSMGSPEIFRLSLDQIDILWSWLANDPECADCLFAWLQCQAKGGEQHALGIEALHHLYLKKLPELQPEGISMVALGLFQQLCSLARIAAAHYDQPIDSLDMVGMGYLWKIALKANNTDVSLAAIQYINSYYMGQHLKLEKEFISHCMNHLTQASDELNHSENRENALMCVQRALMLLNTHLETFRRRYAYHLRRWDLEGKRLSSHSALKSEGPGPPLKIILQPGGVSDKSVLHLHATDLVADLKAEIAKWWETLQGGVKTSGATAPVLGLLLSEGPLRIITQGQEITAEYDERTLVDVGFKDNQMVYVSLGGRGGRRRDHVDHPSLQPPPSKDCLPTLLLLQPQYFEQLFKLMQMLGDMKMPGKRGNLVPHTKAQLLSRRVWDTLAMLPTNSNVLNNLKGLFCVQQKDTSKHSNTDEKMDQDIVESNDENASMASIEDKHILPIQELLDPVNLQKFMYVLHIIESLCKTKYTGNCCGIPEALSKFNTIKIKQLKGNAQQQKSAEIQSPIKVVNDNDIDVGDKLCKEGGKIDEILIKSDIEMKKTDKEKENKKESIKEIKLNHKDDFIPWCDIFINCGGLRHLYEIFMSGVLQTQPEDTDNYNEWRNDSLATLLRVLCLLGIEMKQDDSVPKLSQHLLSLMSIKASLKQISSILYDSSFPTNPNQVRTGFWGRTQVIHFVMNLLVCFVHSSEEARVLLWSDVEFSQWLQRLVLDDPEPAVRREVCTGLYRIALGNAKTCHELMGPLLSKLINFLPIAEKMTLQNINYNTQSSTDEGKEPYGPACRDYFWLVGRLVDTLPVDMVKESLDEPQAASIDIEILCRNVAQSILNREFLETRHGNQDDGLVGLLTIIGNLLKYDPPFKFSAESEEFIEKIFECLFDLPSSNDRHKPKCKSQSSRASAYDLLIEMCRNCPKNYSLLHKKLMEQHRPGPHSPYPWDYWPRDDGRSECGYVGLTNLGATCYMASCIQHLYMMPQAREAILSLPPQAAKKHATTLYELQRMFAYLLESERKSYNPKSFCRVYQMDHQPLNTGEQKDMAEFFIDLVSKLEEMTSELKTLVKRLFCGVLSNNVVSLDCGHVSRTLEEFYTVRCQVADMRNLHESLDEVTVKDTLEGDNMYTCSQCGKKVRAEKRACFKTLPQILCFNTMRYTFNMVTMLKEKVNTHFSFPMKLDMVGYVEKTLMPQQYEEEKQKNKKYMTRNSSESENDQNIVNIDNQVEMIEKIEQLETNEPKTESGSADEEETLEHHEYDLVGVTVHTGTADGGHYYSFIKERGINGQIQDRWLLFNDAEVKIFDPSQIAAECFGGEMTSKTYDTVTEKYLDFSFEKTNSAYMLFYERRNSSNNIVNNINNTDISENSNINGIEHQIPSCSNGSGSKSPFKMANPKIEATVNSNNINNDSNNNSSDDKIFNSTKKETEVIKNINNSDLSLNNNSNISINNKCDIDTKNNLNSSNNNLNNNSNLNSNSNLNLSTTTSSTSKNSTLSKELEEWIWLDNRHFLQDKNIFEHTYFSFMWQICSHIPQTLLMQPDITCIAAQLSVSFFIETFIHAKEKPTMVLWVELLTKQFNSNQEACEWFLTHMSTEPWWPVQVLIQCPNQMVRQMFQRLVIHVIQRLRSPQCSLYLKIDTDDEGKEVIGNASCVTRFIKSLILLLEHGAKAHLRHLSEFFGLLYEFSRMGEEETLFLLQINVIRSVADFYLGHKTTPDCVEKGSDNEENSSDEELSSLSVDKTRPASLDKMIALVANLVERSRGSDLRLHLSSKDYSAIAGGKGFPFLYQQIKDNINPHQTRHLIHALCRWDERLANQIISMLFGAVTKHTELCGPFFKLLTLLTESSGGPSGLPCFSQLVLQRVWDAAEYCPQSALDWLAVQAPRNKIAHAWILQSAESWVEQFLLAHNNSRVRNAAAYLLVSLVPSQTFRTNYRTHHKVALHTAQRELTGDAQLILHTILNLLLRLLRAARAYTDISVHGTGKLTAYFTLMTYCMVSKTEKLMLGPHIRALWELFHPRLSEPSVPVHHNKQALLVFWHHATNECPENAQFVAHCTEITRNIAFNYILADHDDSEIVTYNRAMLPAYYGLLRLCCQQNRQLTRQLAAHQNLQWAFKNITPHPTQYAMAVDELFRLMTLFAARHPDASEAEQREISTFRRTTMSAYLSGLDARVSWGTLIAALRILVDNDEDRLFVIYNGGISMAFDALHTLHSMYHEATACHVSGDLQELLAELVLLIGILKNRDLRKPRPQNGIMKGLPDAVRRLATLLNTFNSAEMRNYALDVLKELVKNCYVEVTTILIPLLTHSHVAAQNSSHSFGPLGPFFPRRGTKNNWSALSKNTPRPPRPMLQMSIPQSQVMQNGLDEEYDAALEAFYKPYHDFLDVMFRMAVNLNQFTESHVNLSCLAGLDAAPLHFNLYPKFWVGIYNNKNTNKYVDLILDNPYLVEYIDLVLRDERISLNDPIIYSFMEIYYPKATSRLAIPRLIDTICQTLPSKENLHDLCADLYAIRIIAQSTGIPPSVHKLLKSCLQTIVTRYKDLFSQDESPPKKRKMSSHESGNDSTELELSKNESSIADLPKTDLPHVEEVKVDNTVSQTETVSKSNDRNDNFDKKDLIVKTSNVQDDQDEIVDIEMDSPLTVSTSSLQPSTSKLSTENSTNKNESSTAACITIITSTGVTVNPIISSSSNSISSTTGTTPPATSKDEKLNLIDDKSCLHKNIENNIEKILNCFPDNDNKS